MARSIHRLDRDDMARACVISEETEHSVLELIENTLEERRGYV